MNYKEDNFDIIGRTAAMASTAIDSMVLALEKSKKENIFEKNVFVRNYQVLYGNEKEEDIYSKYREWAENDVDGVNNIFVLHLYFYHEKSFMQFIHHTDKLTGGNISSLIIDDNYIFNDKNQGTTIDLKIDLKIKGSDVAKAIILKCSLERLKYNENKLQDINLDDITISDVISKDVLLRIVSGDSLVLDKLQNESEYSIKSCKALEKIYADFEKRLLKYEQNLDKAGKTRIEGYVGVEEANKWIGFMTSFIRTFMFYRTNMIHIIRRIIRILAKKTNEEIFKKFGNNNNVPIVTRLYGTVRRLDEQNWRSLTYSDIMRDSKNIMNRHLINMHYNNRLPIIVIPIKDCAFVDGFALNNGVSGSLGSVYSPQSSEFKNLMAIFNSPNPSERDLANAFILYRIKYDELCEDIRKIKPKEYNHIGCIIRIYTRLHDYYKTIDKTEKILKYFPPSILYYSTLIHETTHAIQRSYNIRTLADSVQSVATDNSDLEDVLNDKKNREEKLSIKTRDLAYRISPIHEREAYKEQYNFLMSTLVGADEGYKNKARDLLRKRFGFYISGLNTEV
jgi:hypothetical protein